MINALTQIMHGVTTLTQLINHNALPGLSSTVVDNALLGTQQALSTLHRNQHKHSSTPIQIPLPPIPVGVVVKPKIKRDPLAPKQPMTSYLLFCQDIRATVKASHPNLAQRDIAVEMGKLWKELGADERVKYDIAAMGRREAYNGEMEVYRKKTGVKRSATDIDEDEASSKKPRAEEGAEE